jgi:hypothetical protein
LSYRIEIVKTRAGAGVVEALERVPLLAQEEFNLVLDQAAEIILREEQNQTIRQDAVASETLLNSLGILTTLEAQGGALKQLEVGPRDDRVQLRPGQAPPSVYFRNVVHGREPGSKPPPVRAIIEWMHARGIEPEEGTSERDYVSAAIAIAHVIGEEGIPGRDIPGKTLQQTKFRVVRMFQLAAARVAKRAEAERGKA